MPILHRGGQLLFDCLSQMHLGDEMGRQDFLDQMKWKEATLKTYLTKNMLAPFLSELPTGDLRVLKEGKSGIYSLGVTWYELLTGGTLSPQMFAAGDIPDPTTSAKVNQVIRQMVSYKPADRPSPVNILSLIAEI